jgi:hypothetical protein
MHHTISRNCTLIILGLVCLTSCQLLLSSSACGVSGCKTKTKCSTSYCVDPKCVPAVCPRKTICSSNGSCGEIRQKFCAFLASLKDLVLQSKQKCSSLNTFLPQTAVKECMDPNAVQTQSASASSNRTMIPLGSMISSYRLVAIGGFWWTQIIYYYQMQYYYLMYNTGIRDTRRLETRINSLTELPENLPIAKIDSLLNHFTRLPDVPISEWMTASNLTSLLKCLPDISRFRQINCLSQDNLSSILPL